MRAQSLAILSFYLLAASTPAVAAFKTGNDSLQMCSSPDHTSQGVCLGYVIGVADSIEKPIVYVGKVQGRNVYFPRACIRDGVTAGQIRDIALKWMADHPEHRDASADSIVMMSLLSAFPC